MPRGPGPGSAGNSLCHCGPVSEPQFPHLKDGGLASGSASSCPEHDPDTVAAIHLLAMTFFSAQPHLLEHRGTHRLAGLVDLL